VLQLKVLGRGLGLWHHRPGSYWLKVFTTCCPQTYDPQVTPLARGQEERGVEELRQRAWSLPWPLVEAASLQEGEAGKEVQGEHGLHYRHTEDAFLMFEVQHKYDILNTNPGPAVRARAGPAA
jgi:hypothetical protein